MKSKILILLTFFIVTIHSCKKDEESVSGVATTPYNLIVPNGFPLPIIPTNNPLTMEGIELGRHLFYDPILSSNGLSCSSCHQATTGYSTPFYIAPNGDSISVLPIMNLAFNSDFTWTGFYPTTESVCIEDFTPPFFNTNMDSLVARLQASSKYRNMFYRAFAKNDFANMSELELKTKIVSAIGQFIRTFVSANSKYDRYLNHTENLSATELNGLALFFTEQGDCFHCHGGSLMTSNAISNNGLDSMPTGQNRGLYNFTGNPLDDGRFSIPSLRNVALTAPYMHDGRFKTLEEVVEFYNSGVHQNSPNIDPVMTKAAKQFGLQLTTYEKQCLVDFLKALTDTGFVNNPNYSNPN
ncbi:MAG: cytochrome-c peroxidase [Bacteroidia bacterium]|jgi:cytochrome c peroxidase|nr:cytochrome-c peroxidase [Bacteroidota bacterium]MBP6513306.1 cytochrome-c peroxidase [Bacteroidia bacterium]MBP7245901.1 cytochrome-c peroxidase [Bacteroidia bacterium]